VLIWAHQIRSAVFRIKALRKAAFHIVQNGQAFERLLA
jgi:hypothetical protein